MQDLKYNISNFQYTSDYPTFLATLDICAEYKLRNHKDPEYGLQHMMDQSLTHVHYQSHNSFYIPSKNLIITTTNKAASSALEVFKHFVKSQHPDDFQDLRSTSELYNTIYNNRSKVWFLYRDPLSRMVSFYYYFKKRSKYTSGSNWTWESFDLIRGKDIHKIPQFYKMPFYVSDTIKQRLLDKLDTSNTEVLEELYNVCDYNNLYYDNLSDIQLYENTEYIWVPEIDDDLGLFEYLAEELEVELSETEKGRLIRNVSTYTEIVPDTILEKIWESQTKEREFLKGLTWRNREPVFYDRSV